MMKAYQVGAVLSVIVAIVFYFVLPGEGGGEAIVGIVAALALGAFLSGIGGVLIRRTYQGRDIVGARDRVAILGVVLFALGFLLVLFNHGWYNWHDFNDAFTYPIGAALIGTGITIVAALGGWIEVEP